jgi:flagellar basal-body rod protein FlgG
MPMPRKCSVQKDFETGSVHITKNPFDLAIEGSGFFPVQTPNGQIAYTRDGTFRKDPSGKIVDKNGYPLQPEITVPPNIMSIQIKENGQVVLMTGELGQEPTIAGQIQVVNFINPTGLRAVGKNLFLPTNASGLPQQGVPGENGLGTIAQGQLEGSNVNIVDEMVNMISTQRAYETNSKIVQAADQMLQYSNNLR